MRGRGGMRGEGGVCMAKVGIHVERGACMVKGGCAWQRWGGHAWQRGACVAKGGMRGKGGACVVYPPRYGRSLRGRYASYWNAFLLVISCVCENIVYYC